MNKVKIEKVLKDRLYMSVRSATQDSVSLRTLDYSDEPKLQKYGQEFHIYVPYMS